MKNLKTITFAIAAITFAACKTVPDAPIELVEVIVPVFKTCTEISALTRVVIPAETKTYIAITEIENPGYEPIQRREEQVRVIKEAETIFVNSEGRQVTDICDTEIDPDAPVEVGRAPGA